MPEIIRFYLGEEAILPNVETFSALIPSELDHIRAHARELVLKPANASGGYGVLIGEQATSAQLEETLAQVEAEPSTGSRNRSSTSARFPRSTATG